MMHPRRKQYIDAVYSATQPVCWYENENEIMLFSKRTEMTLIASQLPQRTVPLTDLMFYKFDKKAKLYHFKKPAYSLKKVKQHRHRKPRSKKQRNFDRLQKQRTAKLNYIASQKG